MIARIKKDSQDNLTWERLTSAVVGSTPLGAVYGIYSTTVPDGFLPCNGVQFDTTQYPFLYSLLGDDHTPDLRECTLVGIGENTTDVTGAHNIYTLGQYKDADFTGATEAWTTLHPFDATNNTMTTVINTTGTDKIVTAKSATAGTVTFTPRSKGINYIIKAIPGNEVGDYNYVIDQMEAELALKISLDYVNALPTGSDIESNIYGYNGHYYIGDSEHATLTQLANDSDLTALQPKTLDTSLTIGGSTITTVEDALAALNTVKLEKGIKDVNALPVSPNIEDLVYRYNGDIYFGDSTNQTTTLLDAEAVVWVDENDPLPTGAAIKAKLYVQPETIGSSTKYHYYVGDTTATPHALIEMSTGGSDIFVGTQAEWNNLSAAEQAQYTQANITDVNSVVNVPVDTIADGNMNPVTSNAVYDGLYRNGTAATSIYNWNVDHPMTVAEGAYNFTHSETIAEDGWYLLRVEATQKNQDQVLSNYCKISIGNYPVVSTAGFIAWAPNQESVVVPIKAGTVINVEAHYDAENADNISTIHFHASITKLN